MMRRLQRREALGLLAAASGLALPWRTRADSAVPLTWRHTGDIGALLLAEATLGGRALRLVVDTGASAMVLSPAIARALALPVIERVRVATLGGVQQVDRVSVEGLRLGALTTPASNALALDLRAMLGPALDGVDGLIGMPALRGAACLFDLARQRLLLGSDAEPLLKDLPRHPLRFEQGLPVIDLRIGERDSAPFVLDTGNAGALVIFEHYARRLLEGAPSLPQTTVRELGGEVSARHALIERVSGPGFTAASVPVAFEVGARARRGGTFDSLAGSLGSALFRGAAFGWDAEQPPGFRIAATTLPTLPGGFGFALDGALPARASAVIDGSPAARAGLVPGSRLISVDGRDAQTLHAHQVWEALHGVDVATFEWTAPGKTSPQRMTLQRERFLPPFS